MSLKLSDLRNGNYNEAGNERRKTISKNLLRRHTPFPFKEVSCFTVDAKKSFSFIFCHNLFFFNQSSNAVVY